MRASNKVLLAAVAVFLALFLAFVLVMAFTTRDLLRSRGTTALAWPVGPRPACEAPIVRSAHPPG